jgi:hypothetical protein
MSATQLWQLLAVTALCSVPLALLAFALLRRLVAWLAGRLPSRHLRAYPVRRRAGKEQR